MEKSVRVQISFSGGTAKEINHILGKKLHDVMEMGRSRITTDSEGSRLHWPAQVNAETT